MARFGWSAMIKAVLATALVTSAGWLWVGMVYLQPDARTAAVTPGRTLGLAAERAAPAPQVASGKLAMPVAGVNPATLVDTFTQARSGGRVHDAIDILAPRGTPVTAAAPGTVEKLFVSALGGNTVYLRSPDRRLIYYYAHLDAYAAGLSEGRTVRTGDALGTVGSTGNADPAAPHLHFAVLQARPEAKWHEPAIAVNPYPLLTGRR